MTCKRQNPDLESATVEKAEIESARLSPQAHEQSAKP